ncbi:unnamed protein product [Caenorhabditis brenneri]
MKHWRFFPILVKIEVLRNMDLSDRLSFSKCSKKCRNLLSRTPNHLESFIIPDDDDFSVDDFLTLMTCQKSTIQELQVEIDTAQERYHVNQFLLKLREVGSTLKVRKLIMEICSKYSEMYKKVIGFCDPFSIESIEIESLGSQEIYEHILKTPQWRNSQKISLNWSFDKFLKVNLNDFLHFKSMELRVEELSVEDAWKLVQNIVSIGSQGDSIDIILEKPVPDSLIREKIESELAGDWKDVGSSDGRYLRHPENPHLILEYLCSRNELDVALRTLEELNM